MFDLNNAKETLKKYSDAHKQYEELTDSFYNLIKNAIDFQCTGIVNVSMVGEDLFEVTYEYYCGSDDEDTIIIDGEWFNMSIDEVKTIWKEKRAREREIEHEKEQEKIKKHELAQLAELKQKYPNA